MPDPHTLAEQWAQFSVGFASVGNRLTRELEECFQDLRGILEGQTEQLAAMPAELLDRPELSRFHEIRAENAGRLLVEPVARWERRRPYKRAMLAIESYERSLQELIRSLPESVDVSGRQALDVLGPSVAKGIARRLAALRRKQRPLMLRAIIAFEIKRLAAGRIDVEGKYLAAVARASRQLRENWEVRRKTIDAAARGGSKEEPEAEAVGREIEACSDLFKQAETVLVEWRNWLEASRLRLAERLLEQAAWHRNIKAADSDQDGASYLAHWGDQFGSVEAEVRLEKSLEHCEDRILDLSRRSIESLAQERSDLTEEIDEFVCWLRDRLEDNEQFELPAPRDDVVPAASRLAELESDLKGALKEIPQTLRILPELSPHPRRRAKPKQLHPRQAIWQTYERTGRARIKPLFQAVDDEHHRLVREIERAREVVAFGLFDDGNARDPQITREALENALSLLEFNQKQVNKALADADAGLARTMAAVFEESRLIMSRNRLGVLAYLGQQGLRRALIIGSRIAIDYSKQIAKLSYGGAQRLARDLLVYIGWAERASGVSEVVTRPFLPREFTLDLSAKQLPAIYRRLFRFEPVEDPRFLVGREREMEAIAEARNMWESGRPVALLIIGERGSGKTSLINCAMKRPLQGLEVARGEFCERLSDAGHLREFIGKLVGLADPASIKRELVARRRVVILEELERTFLRQIGHYSAVRELQRLIAATCSTTLWIVVTNKIAFSFLDAAVSLGLSFSHRINAASAGRNALREAILLRHNLSGLRLEFTLSPAERDLRSRIGKRLRGHADPEEVFFDRLAKESAGVFRTAFEIWLGQIDSAEAGALVMKPFVPLNMSPVIDALDQDDLFNLVAVLQHGSLTPEEHATIFQVAVDASRARIDGLLAREVIEPDPGRPGFRVRPEAQRIVKEALYRRNLI